MKTKLTFAAAVIGGAMLALPANAAPMTGSLAGVQAAGSAANYMIETVQYRRYGYGPRYGYRGYRGGYYRGNRGAAVGAGIAAGALGALAVGALAAQPRYYEPAPVYGAAPVYVSPDADAVAYCSRRFRTYDPETGTYIGNGGVVRACP